MRSDMKYIVLDEPRQNHDYRENKGEKRKQQRGLENLPLRESMKTRWHFHHRKSTRIVGRDDHRKNFSDHLGPLLGFLRSRCGRPWDEVHSEIRKHADYHSVLGFHLVYHFLKLVKRQVFIRDGLVITAKQDILCSGQFYVHPETGLLCCIA